MFQLDTSLVTSTKPSHLATIIMKLIFMNQKPTIGTSYISGEAYVFKNLHKSLYERNIMTKFRNPTSAIKALLHHEDKEKRPIARLIVLWAIFIPFETLAVQTSYEIAWIRQIGTSGQDISNAVAVDTLSHIYISGTTNGVLGETHAGGDDAFIIKYDPSGNHLWSRQIGPPNVENCNAATTGSSGDIYISGFTTGNLGGSSSGGADAFLVKYDPSGTHLWSGKVDSGYYDNSLAVAADAFGNIYISGKTDGDIVLSAGGTDAFLVKFNESGSVLWSRQKGNVGTDESNAVAVDAQGNVYISGYTDRSLCEPTHGGYDAFVIKYEGSGIEHWSKQIGTSGEDRSNAVTVDATGNVYISGFTTGSLENCVNAGGTDAFLIKYSPNGNFVWARQLGTSDNDTSHSVAVDSSGNIYITGTTAGNLNDIGAGGEDIFLACYDTEGTLLWSRQIGTIGDDVSRSVAIDAWDNVYITGYTNNNLGGTHAGGDDAFLIKFQPMVTSPPLAGDANLDGIVNVGDLGILAAHYGQSNCTWAQGDFNDDGIVNVGDLGILAANYGQEKANSPFDLRPCKARTTVQTQHENTTTCNNSQTTDPWVCPGMGLFLIMGIFLSGLLFDEFRSKK